MEWITLSPAPESLKSRRLKGLLRRASGLATLELFLQSQVMDPHTFSFTALFFDWFSAGDEAIH